MDRSELIGKSGCRLARPRIVGNHNLICRNVRGRLGPQSVPRFAARAIAGAYMNRIEKLELAVRPLESAPAAGEAARGWNPPDMRAG